MLYTTRVIDSILRKAGEMIRYPQTRIALRGLPRRVTQTVYGWIARGVPRTAQILIDHEQLYHALKSDLASNEQPTS